MTRKYFIRIIVINVILWAVLCGKNIFADEAVLAQEEDFVAAQIGDEDIYFSQVLRSAEKLNRFLKENFQTSQSWRLDYVRKLVARKALAKRAQREGISEHEDVKQDIEAAGNGILADRILTEKLTQITVTEDDLKKHYEENKQRYRITDKMKISYVKFSGEKQTKRFIGKLKKGQSFKKAAGRKKVEIDNWVSKDEPMIPGLDRMRSYDMQKILSLEAGESSEPVEINGEYFVIHIDEKLPAQDRPFEDVREQVEFAVHREKRNQLATEFITETFSQEKVKIYDDRIRESMKK